MVDSKHGWSAVPRVQSLIATSETRRRSEDRRYEGSRIRGPRSQFYLGVEDVSDGAAGVGAGVGSGSGVGDSGSGDV